MFSDSVLQVSSLLLALNLTANHSNAGPISIHVLLVYQAWEKSIQLSPPSLVHVARRRRLKLQLFPLTADDACEEEIPRATTRGE